MCNKQRLDPDQSEPSELADTLVKGPEHGYTLSYNNTSSGGIMTP